MHARMNVASEQGYKSYAHMSMQRHCMFKEPEKAIGFIMDTLRKVKFEIIVGRRGRMKGIHSARLLIYLVNGCKKTITK